MRLDSPDNPGSSLSETSERGQRAEADYSVESVATGAGYRSQTPESANPPNLLIPASTPIKKDQPVQALFSTLTRFRIPTLNNIGKRMTGRFVGPMPVNRFLDNFLPTTRIPEYYQATNFLPRSSLRRTVSAGNELGMYDPFIEEMEPFAPRLHFVDSHARGDKRNGYPFEIKPDISIYHGSVVEDPPLNFKASEVDMFVEFKWYDFDNPFLVPPKPPSECEFIVQGDTRRDTIGQIAAYTAAIFTSQFRTHIFSVLVQRDHARIIRWDKEGAIVTEPIPYDTDSSLVEFFSRFSQAPPELRGIDTTVTKPTNDEAAVARKKLGLKRNVPMLKTFVPANDNAPPITIIFANPHPLPTIPAGRSTRACPAYDILGHRLVFFKDSWRLGAADIIPEGQIYADLSRNNVRFIPSCLASGDVECWDEQRPQTYRESSSPWAYLVGSSLTQFRTSKEMVQAIHDALLAHQDAFRAGYLHRDLSPGNIVRFNGHGYLIDWDLAKSTQMPLPRQLTRTGTWQFVSARLVEDPTGHHTFRDDLESTFWVLLWTALMYSPSSFDTPTLSSFIRRTFESNPGGEEKRSMFTSQTKLKTNLFPGRPLLYGLVKDLADLFRDAYYEPTALEWEKYHMLKAKHANTGNLNDILEFNLTALHVTSSARLESHDYMISRFAACLQETGWPSADCADPQALSGINAFGEEDDAATMRSKHVLSRMEEEDKQRKRARTDS